MDDKHEETTPKIAREYTRISRILNYLVEEGEREYSIDLRNDKKVMGRLKYASYYANKNLSHTGKAVICLPYITVDASGSMHLIRTLTRSMFDDQPPNERSD